MRHSPLVQQLIDAFTCLPGVGPKSAQRMAYYLLERHREGGEHLAAALHEAMEGVGQCSRCRNFAEAPLCPVCMDTERNPALVCVVASPADVLAFEQAGGYNGRYFVLAGHLSPIDGMGPEEVGLPLLQQQLGEGHIEEIILATSSTVEGEVTAHYIQEMCQQHEVLVSRLAQGVPVGGELEFVSGATLAQALSERRSVKP
ncbi:MAG TPA: recombination mediator RecR [Alcanivoracaceae bacterium]|nr:recombination mediator RecR [Alcanivoracaceae bacterium]